MDRIGFEILNEKQNKILSDMRLLEYSKKYPSSFSHQELDNLNKKQVIFENQKKMADDILNVFNNLEKCYCLLISPTQSGKNGIILSIVNSSILDKQHPINPENICLITGYNQVEWLKQNKERTFDYFSNNIFHLNSLDKFEKFIRNKQNVIIIIDECHLASGKNMSIDKVFKKLDLFNIQKLYRDNIRIVELSATPSALLHNILLLDDKYYSVLGNKYIDYDKYTSCYKLLENNQVKQFKDIHLKKNKLGDIHITSQEALTELKKVIEDKYNFPKYHIVRIRTKLNEYIDTLSNFKLIFDKDDYDFLPYNESVSTDINEILSQTPLKHTFILLKEKCRCSKTLVKDNIGVLYERKSTLLDDNVIIQSLIGRATGYDDNSHITIFTNIPSIERYKSFYNDILNGIYTKYGRNTDKITYNYNEKLIKSRNDILLKENNIYGVKIFDDMDDVNSFYIENVKGYIHKLFIRKDAITYKLSTELKKSVSRLFQQTQSTKKYRLMKCINDEREIKYLFLYKKEEFK